MKLDTIKKSKIIKKLLNILLNIFIGILSIILLVATYTAVQVKVLNHEYPSFFGYTMFEVQTNSMESTINAGDWIIVRLNSKVELNDIITYKLKNDYITHRVVEKYDKTYVTAGDANNTKDKPIDQNQVIGKVTKILGGFGILRKTILNPIVLIFLIISLFLIESILKDKNNENNNKLVQKIIDKIKKIVSKNKSKLKIKSKLNISKKVNPKIKTNAEQEKITPAVNLIEKDILEIKPDPVEEEILEIKPSTEGSAEESILSEKDIIEIKPEEEISKIKGETDEEIIVSPLEEEKTEPEEESEISEIKVEEEESDIYVEDDLEKTQLFRIIPIDTKDIDKTRLEIAEYEMANTKKEEKKKELAKVEVPESEIEEPEELTKIELDLLKPTNRKNKNTIDALMNIKSDELSEMVLLVVDNDKLQINEPTIRNAFITAYIHARYYNYFSEKELNYKGKNFLIKVDKLFKAVGKELKEKYQGNDNKYNEKVDKFVNIFNIIASIDQAKDLISDLKTKREFYKNELVKHQKDIDNDNLFVIVNEIISLQTTYNEINNYFFRRFSSEDFDLKKTSIVKDLYATNLVYKINFSKVYSDYILEKTFEEGIVAEDKLPVKTTLLSVELLKDMINGDFHKKYALILPESLYGKEKKIKRILNNLNDEYAKSHVIILIDFSVLIKSRKIVKRIRRSGYKFAVAFEDSSILPPKDKSTLYMANHIFINKKDELYNKLENYIPKDLKDFIIYEDVYEKFESLERTV